MLFFNRKGLPAPETFAQGHRALAMALASLGGMACGAGVTGIVLILWLGDWAVETQPQRIEGLSIAMIGMILGMVLVILGLLVGGPVGRLKGGVGKDGATFELHDDDDGEEKA